MLQDLVHAASVGPIPQPYHRELPHWHKVASLEGAWAPDLVDNGRTGRVEHRPRDEGLDSPLWLRHPAGDDPAVGDGLLVPHEEEVRERDVERYSGKDRADPPSLFQRYARPQEKDVEDRLGIKVLEIP